jgi:hypothetical protein
MEPDELAEAHYIAQQQIARIMAEEAQELWRQVSAPNVIEQWLELLAVLMQVMTRRQLAAAGLTNYYLEQLAAAQGIAPPTWLVNPAALAGIASDGRALANLLMQPALRTAGLLARGADDETALRSGLATLVRAVDTTIADTSRAADQVGIASHRSWVMYVRHVELPACGRCIILAGRSYSWSTGFQRHPLCDCTMVPVSEGDELPPSPSRLFEQMTPAEQARAFTAAGAEAIRLGADPGQVVNARRGMQTAGGRLITTEGTTVRGIAGRKLGELAKVPGERYRRSRRIRPMPETILAETDGDREVAIRRLEQYGYILPGSQRPAPAPQRARVTIPHLPRPEPEPVAQAARSVVPAGARPYHRHVDGLEDLAAAVEDGQPPAATRRLGGSSAQTELVTLSGGTTVIRKSGRTGSEDLQDAAAEQLTSMVARALGLRAPGVYQRDESSIWMEYIADGETAEEAGAWGSDLPPRFAAVPDSDAGRLMGLLDVLVNNVDRNDGNWMLTPGGELVPIDHGLAYDGIEADAPATLEWVNSKFADHYQGDGNPLTAADVAEVRRRLRLLRADFEHVGRGHWLDYSLRVLDLLAKDAAGDRPLIAGIR